MHIPFQPSERSLSGLGVLLTLMPCPWSAGEFLSKKFQLLGCPLWQSQGTIIHHLEETDKKFNSNHQKGLSFRKKKEKKTGEKRNNTWGNAQSYKTEADILAQPRHRLFVRTSKYYEWLWTLIEDLVLFWGGKKIYCIWQTMENVKLKVVAI